MSAHGRSLRYVNLAFLVAVSSMSAACTPGTAAGDICPVWAVNTPRDNSLFLYMPTADDTSFPAHPDGTAGYTPLRDFDVADLDSAVGSTDDLRNRILDLVTDDYCEFNVGVSATTTNPSPSVARWQIVGIGSDANPSLFGQAFDVDTTDTDAQDYARVWAGTFASLTELTGTGSTLDRWATAIGSTVSHEAAHDYGVPHSAATARAGEDSTLNHIIATSAMGLTGEMRAGVNRHFGDNEYEILGYNVGLITKTLHNWDFENPNAENASKMTLTLLSAASTLTLNWTYNGSSSPWKDPVVASSGTSTFQGQTYNKYDLTFSTVNPAAPDGIASTGEDFHTGASFSQPDAVIVRDVTLYDSGGTALTLAPRMPGYDVGSADAATGDFVLSFFAPDAGAGGSSDALIIESLRVFATARMADINTMVSGAKVTDIRGEPVIDPERQDALLFESREPIRVDELIRIPIASFGKPRSVEEFLEAPPNCRPGIVEGDGSGDSIVGEYEYCVTGPILSLFPSTYVYLEAVVVDPNARHWDPERQEYIEGPVTTRIFYQFSGIKPDFNGNQVDDIIDIHSGESKDEDGNGVPDEAQR
jgi:hypothetical protein